MKVAIVAEAGVNHNGCFETAREMVKVAREAGADAIKFQTFRADKYISQVADKAQYQLAATDQAETQVDMMRKLELSYDEFRELKDFCATQQIEFLSTPFEVESVQFLASLGVSRLKIPSGEITNAPLLYESARTGLPIILSTGMATLSEVEDALCILSAGYAERAAQSITEFRAFGQSEEGKRRLRERVTVLHCTTEYPTPFEDVHLRAIPALRTSLGLPIGFSDHTPGVSAALGAVALGACLVEKHFTLDKNAQGPDHKASLEPEELKHLVQSIRELEEALGQEVKAPSKSEQKNIPIARKSLVAACDISKGDAFTMSNLTAKRPGTGASPLFFYDWLGRNATRDVKADEVLRDADVE